VAAWVRRNDSELYTTSITLAEIGCGIERLPAGHHKELLRSTAAGCSPTSRSAFFPSTRRRLWHTSRS